jgi:hypothetical protein
MKDKLLLLFTATSGYYLIDVSQLPYYEIVAISNLVSVPNAPLLIPDEVLAIEEMLIKKDFSNTYSFLQTKPLQGKNMELTAIIRFISVTKTIGISFKAPLNPLVSQGKYAMLKAGLKKDIPELKTPDVQVVFNQSIGSENTKSGTGFLQNVHYPLADWFI